MKIWRQCEVLLRASKYQLVIGHVADLLAWRLYGLANVLTIIATVGETMVCLLLGKLKRLAA